MSDRPGEAVKRETCWFCGAAMAAISYPRLNEMLVEHGREKHSHELENERDRPGTFDPITIADLIRDGPDSR